MRDVQAGVGVLEAASGATIDGSRRWVAAVLGSSAGVSCGGPCNLLTSQSSPSFQPATTSPPELGGSLVAGRWKIAATPYCAMVATSVSNDQERIQHWGTRNLPRLLWCWNENITRQLSPATIQQMNTVFLERKGSGMVLPGPVYCSGEIIGDKDKCPTCERNKVVQEKVLQACPKDCIPGMFGF